MLSSMAVDTKMVEVVDNNSIDAAVTAYKPTHVIIEAFWVVPTKFDVLKPLHPNISWIVRNHSEVPFLSSEGVAAEWVAGYLQRNVEVMCNSPRALADVQALARAYNYPDRLVTYGPNYYPVENGGAVTVHSDRSATTINVGCFGAIRPLKNQFAQALAAITFARFLGVKLNFHINGSRIEGNGDPILKNIQALFAATHDCTLVQHPWLPHADFLTLVATMDIMMQVSFSETYNIVGADAASMNVPLVASSELPWLGPYGHANPTDMDSMVSALQRVWLDPNPSVRLYQQRRDLRDYNVHSEGAWATRFGFQAPTA